MAAATRAMDKDLIIVEQQYKISSLADESEKLRQERDELLAMLKEIGSRSHCAGQSHSDSKSWDQGLDSQSMINPHTYKQLTKATRNLPLVIPQVSRARSRSSGHNKDTEVGPTTSASDGWYVSCLVILMACWGWSWKIPVADPAGCTSSLLIGVCTINQWSHRDDWLVM